MNHLLNMNGRGRSGQCRWFFVLILLFLIPLATLGGQAGYSGGSGTRDDPYLIGTVNDLLALAADPNEWTGHFRLTADIDMAKVPRDTVCMIGDATIPFRGTFDGAGKRILHFTCICPERNRVGLFGHIRAINGGVRNLCLVDPNVEGRTGTSVGALVGHLGTGAVTGCRVEGGRVSGAMAVGGLIGWSYATIAGCAAQAEVCGQYSVGGLVGLCAWDAEVRDCVADANVVGISRVGGLAGACTLAIIQWSSAKGLVTGSSNVAGLIGCNEGAAIQNCYSTTSVQGDSMVGGLVGDNGPSCDCSVGRFPGVIYNCYSTGRVTGDANTGGLVGFNEADCTVDGCFWDTQTSGMTRSAEGTGLPTARLQTASTFTQAGWDFSPKTGSADYWVLLPEPQYPTFAWQILQADPDIHHSGLGQPPLFWEQRSTTFQTEEVDMSFNEPVDRWDPYILCEQKLIDTAYDR